MKDNPIIYQLLFIIATKLKFMKKILMIITIAFVFAGCNSGKSDLETNKILLTDTSGIHNGSASSDTSTAVKTGARPAAVTKTTHTEKSGTTTSTSGNSGNAASTNNGTTTTTTTSTTQKKGWSNRAKGAVIGGAAGAVGGAIVSKHKGTGAVIGGVVGAAGGYIIGNEKDKKNNR
jgi:hypothetical protein